jgi:hypothetical protein
MSEVLTQLTVLALAAQQPMGAPDCILSAIPEAQRSSIGEAILAKRAKEAADNAALFRATDDCARKYRLSTERALHANGYAAMRMAAETLARKLGHPEWAGYALVAVRERPRAQREALAGTGSGGAEFELVLQRMIHQDRTIGATLQSWDKEPLERFVLMVKLFAVAEVERDKAALP